MQKLALYTTVYPGAEGYLQDWHRSVQAQTDMDFRLWIGLDGVTSQSVETAIGSHLEADWVPSESGATPAHIRQRSLTQITKYYDAVVLADCDDILHPTRVAAARAALETSELTACALRLVDQHHHDLGMTLTLSDEAMPEDIFPQHNVFGFSNSAYRSELLKRCLPIPREIALVDWFLATKAWLLAAKLAFDPVIRMDYRQHGANMAPIRFPFSANQVVRDTEKVSKHFELLQASLTDDMRLDRRAQVKKAAEKVHLFSEHVVSQPDKLANYLRRLNRLKPRAVWWWDVAHPALDWMWKNQIETRYETCKN